MSDTAWLALAFTVVWLALGAYLVSLSVRQRRLEHRLRDIDRAE